MRQGFRRPSPALVVATLALFAALGGTVYAAKRIDGRTIKLKSLPGNRLVPGSVPGNRLKPGAIPASRLVPGSITGAQIDEPTLAQVPSALRAASALRADSAERADSAALADRAERADIAGDAETVDGHSVGCPPGTKPFAGACWQEEESASASTAADAAAACAAQGGALPEALELRAFSQQAGVTLAETNEWTNDLTNLSGLNAYGVVTVAADGDINYTLASDTKKYRCVLPLLR